MTKEVFNAQGEVDIRSQCCNTPDLSVCIPPEVIDQKMTLYSGYKKLDSKFRLVFKCKHCGMYVRNAVYDDAS